MVMVPGTINDQLPFLLRSVHSVSSGQPGAANAMVASSSCRTLAQPDKAETARSSKAVSVFMGEHLSHRVKGGCGAFSWFLDELNGVAVRGERLAGLIHAGRVTWAPRALRRHPHRPRA